MDTLLGTLVGMGLGASVAWWIARILQRSEGDPSELRNDLAAQADRIQELEREVAKLNERGNQYQQQLEEKQGQLQQIQAELAEATTGTATLAAQKKAVDDKLAEQQSHLKELQQQFRIEFENVANKLLEEKSRKFTELNKEKMEGLLKPLGENIESFRKKVEETHKESTEQQIKFREQLEQLGGLHHQMSADAQNLTNALKGEAQVRGAWGEMVLERLLEQSGLKKDLHYAVQQSFAVDGGQHRPDVVIHMPEERNLVVDSKVSLVHYEKYCSADTHDEATIALKGHVAAMRKHAKELGEKNYHSLYELSGLDFVLMFVPIEPAFMLAAEATLDPQGNAKDLFSEAFDQGVVIVTTSTLLATLKTIKSIWRREDQNRYASEIAKESGAMYDKFKAFVDDLEKIGTRIRQANESYDAAMNKLSEGRGNLVRRAEKIRNLGASNTKLLPESLRSDVEQDPPHLVQAETDEPGAQERVG